MINNYFSVLFCAAALFGLSACGTQYQFRSSTGAVDSSYIYQLPYAEGRKKLMVQGYNSRLSHQGRMALDFKMRKGTPVHAARSGVVVRVVDTFSRGGLHRRYYRRANMVVLLHADGSQAYYGHLKNKGAVVQVGDSVKQGQHIAYSGSTGYSFFPHLHFIVWGPVPGGGRSQLPTRFQTHKGVVYLKPGSWYRK